MRQRKQQFWFGLLIIAIIGLVGMMLWSGNAASAQDDPTETPATEVPTTDAPLEPTADPSTISTDGFSLPVDTTDAPSDADILADVVEEEPTIDALDTVWLLVTAFLVFFMQAGFALVEGGFVRAKNIVNIMMKNMFDFAVGSIMFFVVGFGIMFGTGNDFFGTEWFLLNDIPDIYPGLAVPTYAFFFFQLVFAAIAATIASGAMAERTEFMSYVVVSALATAIIYPVVGHWIWGGGWLYLRDTPFHDFAGSTVVHSTGAWLGLMGTIFLGP